MNNTAKHTKTVVHPVGPECTITLGVFSTRPHVEQATYFPGKLGHRELL